MTRDDFRNGVFARDNNRCVVCGSDVPPLDAHHIIERRLFDDGGYYLSNGATLCGTCHLQAEQTVLSCEQVREAAGIKEVVLPDHLYPDMRWDKWANQILPNGTRMWGDLYGDESVTKVLEPVLDRFLPWIKYPRTWHLPFSPGLTKGDRVLPDTSHFEGQEVVVTPKYDGENTTWYRDYLHARSLDGRNHPSRNWNKNLHAQVAWQIPERWRVCGENLFAKHTIKYANLPAYFLVFSIWNEANRCLSWDQTAEWCQLLDLPLVPTLYRGVWSEEWARHVYQPTYDGDACEGFVVRLAGEFAYKDFRRSVAKYVRQGHVGAHGHWMHSVIERNGVRKVAADDLGV